jgi:hypothetical protein
VFGLVRLGFGCLELFRRVGVLKGAGTPEMPDACEQAVKWASQVRGKAMASGRMQQLDAPLS